MFKLQKMETFEWPVKVNVPTEGGRHQPYEFTGIFQMMGQSEVNKNLDIVQESLNDGGEGDIILLRKLVRGWKNVRNHDDTELQYSEESKEQLLDIPYVRTAFLRAYFDAVNGNKVKRGN